MNLLKPLSFSVILFILVISCKKEDDVVISEPAKEVELISNLTLDASVNLDSVIVNEEVVFTIKLSNSGPSKATDVIVMNYLPDGYDLKNYDISDSSTFDSNNGEWIIDELAADSAIYLNLVSTINSSGNYVFRTEVIASKNKDPNSIPNNDNPLEDDQDSAMAKLQLIRVSTYAVIKAGDGLTIDLAGNLYAANFGQSKVYKIDNNAVVSAFISNQPGSAGMVFDDQGILNLANYNSAQIVRIDQSGNVLNVLASGVANPIALDFNSQGVLFTNNNYNNAITSISQAGVKNIIYTSTFNNSSLTLDENDNVYVSDYNSGVIKKIDSQTRSESTFTTLPIVNGGIGFIIYSHGYFFASAISDNVIYMIDEKGNYKKIAGTEGVSGKADGTGDVATFDKPNGMVTSADGKTLFVAQQGNHFGIRKITGYRK